MRAVYAGNGRDDEAARAEYQPQHRVQSAGSEAQDGREAGRVMGRLSRCLPKPQRETDEQSEGRVRRT